VSREKDAYCGVIGDLENKFFGCRVPFDAIPRLYFRINVNNE
jgi:hypothetical protein